MKRAVTCQACGRTWETSQRARYCSDVCRVDGHRAKKRASKPLYALEQASSALVRAVQSGDLAAVGEAIQAVEMAYKAAKLGE